MKKNCVVLYKSGKFYNVFGDHGLIIHHLLGYKFVEYKQAVGFPESAYSRVITTLQDENISYEVYEKETFIEKYKGVDKAYAKVLKEALKNYDMEKRITRLKNRINDFSVDDLEKIIEGIESDSIK